MPYKLTDGREKLKRAQEHLKALESEITKFFKANPNAIVIKRENEGRDYVAYLHWTEPPDAARWGLITGDGLHNARSALDNAVYQLAVATHGDPPPDETLLQFPICDGAAHWLGQSSPRRSGPRRTAFEACGPMRLQRLSRRSPTTLGMTSPSRRCTCSVG